MENQRIAKSLKSTSTLNSKQSPQYIQQPKVLIQQHPTQLVQKSVQQNIPLIPLKQVNRVMSTRETPIFKQNQEESYPCTKDATSLMAKLDSLIEIKSYDSPITSHVSPIPSTLQSVVVLNQNNPAKSQQLQQVACSSCVEPFKVCSKSVAQSQQLIKTLPPKKNYETMIEVLMKEQELLVQQYNTQVNLLENKAQELSYENNNLVEQNKLFLEQNLQLNDEVTQLKSKQLPVDPSTQQAVQVLEYQLEQKKGELNQLIEKMNEILSINQKTQEKNNELSQQVNTILEQKEKEINAYFTQITKYKQTIQELELKITQLLQNDLLQQKTLKETQNKLTVVEQSERHKQNQLPQQQQLKYNVKETFEYKQLVLELDSKCVTITEKENQIETLKIKNQMMSQQLAQTQGSQVSLQDLQEALRQRDRENENLKSDLINKEEEIERLNQSLKLVRKEKAKLSINLMNAGMANLVMMSQNQTQQDETTN
ncbi:unnamed protein product (macronuclear) [Paramecium tetraurelia]|uniref:Uncharacterized protein n=1 Tax=Paramecium tetraurelia TaxID=5888 RepID=A0BH70_PARTE|nr:uncharacterized protein GSPATT00028922001 [Paramecium tetraurelia]CAK57887.1 unnamed protein product [Paramecium tetraurelia]|eukprot:XP_001425285.1 hypothetical protein (macronuclear) [Paramecium tetraurelia strain d4-2]